MFSSVLFRNTVAQKFLMEFRKAYAEVGETNKQCTNEKF
jgi:hypothetical protein